MRIKITRMLGDVDPSCRPKIGEEYEVIKVLASECVITEGTVR